MQAADGLCRELWRTSARKSFLRLGERFSCVNERSQVMTAEFAWPENTVSAAYSLQTVLLIPLDRVLACKLQCVRRVIALRNCTETSVAFRFVKSGKLGKFLPCRAERACDGTTQGRGSMISGLYSAATSMNASTKRHELAAENLANIQMPGYRRRMMTQATFDTMMSPQQQSMDGAATSNMLGTATSPVKFDFTPGPIESTKRPLDFALSGDGFFTVKGPEGPLYTRNGSFHVDGNRQLVTIDNLPVMGAGGPIVLPANVNSETVEVSLDGRLYGNGVQFGELDVVRFEDTDVLQAAGASLFSASPDAIPLPSSAEVLQGRLELANTSSIHELIQIMSVSRQFDAAQKAMNTITESVQRRIGLR
jgi:flagellar basal body rod protein FlgG